MKWIAAGVLTLCAALASWQWGLVILRWPFSVISTPGTSDSTVIREQTSVQIVNPDTLGLGVGRTPDGILRWLVAETEARMAIIMGVLGILIALIMILGRRATQKSGPAGSATDDAPS
jgi:hypothetical protein